MCYNVNYLTKKKEEYARRILGKIQLKNFDQDWKIITSKTGPVYYDTGFSFPDIPVITSERPDTLQLYTWGLIPFWVKAPEQAESLRKQTLNARGEDIYEKPAFRNAAKRQHCLILLDGFFEYHWEKDKSYPFYIKMKNDEPMLMGGLWENWRYEKEGIQRNTFTIITTRANPMMEYIHNRPKGSEGPRMPVIVPPGMEEAWLSASDDKVGKDKARSVLQPFDARELEAYTVPKLRGKEGTGNSPKAIEEYSYAELS